MGHVLGSGEPVAQPQHAQLAPVAATIDADFDEAAHAFLVDVLGAEYMYRLGPFRSDDDWMAEHMDVHPRTVMEQLRFYRIGGQAVLEVFQYDAPDQAAVLSNSATVAGPVRKGTPGSAAPCNSRRPPS